MESNSKSTLFSSSYESESKEQNKTVQNLKKIYYNKINDKKQKNNNLKHLTTIKYQQNKTNEIKWYLFLIIFFCFNNIKFIRKFTKKKEVILKFVKNNCLKLNDCFKKIIYILAIKKKKFLIEQLKI